jgi:hypothetical protein
LQEPSFPFRTAGADDIHFEKTLSMFEALNPDIEYKTNSKPPKFKIPKTFWSLLVPGVFVIRILNFPQAVLKKTLANERLCNLFTPVRVKNGTLRFFSINYSLRLVNIMTSGKMTKIAIRFALLPGCSLILAGKQVVAQHIYIEPVKQDTMTAPEESTELNGGIQSAFSYKHAIGRDGSGTSWHPEDSHVFGHRLQFAGLHILLQGTLFPRFSIQDAFDSGSRGGSDWRSSGWTMATVSTMLSKHDQFLLRILTTLDAITEDDTGYPLLLQTGGALDEELFIDRQHPHDLIGELALAYSRQIAGETGFTLYFGYPGEPALGPPSFRHRPSSRNNPNPPLSNQWQDASHITFGVATIGIGHENLKVEGSVFTGREPNDSRFGFDKPRFDSYSLRLSANSGGHWAFQISRAFVNSPVSLYPDSDLFRTTASILHEWGAAGGYLSTSLVWGLNSQAKEGIGFFGGEAEASVLAKGGLPLLTLKTNHVPTNLDQHSFLLESNFATGVQDLYARVEVVEKAAADLGIGRLVERKVSVAAISLGATRRSASFSGLGLRAGLLATLYRVPPSIRQEYGKWPVSLEFYLNLYSRRIRAHN